jgi:hypothetical protein
MKAKTVRILGFGVFAAACLGLMPPARSAASSLLAFDFDEGEGSHVTDSINALSGGPNDPANPPMFATDSPSSKTGDTSVHFELGQYFVVDDPDTRLKLDQNNPSFTLQAWVKFSGFPAQRMVFFYSNGPGGAISFSVNNNRTVHVTTLGIADVASQAAIPDDGDWHHIAVVHENGVELRFYVDGVLRDTVPYTGSVNFSRTQKLISIGAEWNGALQYVGSLDRLKVSSGILTPEQLDSQAAPPTPLAVFEFDEGSGNRVADSINSLSGYPFNPANSPSFAADAPSGQMRDFAVRFEPGQYFVVNDPDTRIQLSRSRPHFTLQAWVKFSGFPAQRMVFFYSEGPGGAISFSVNNDRTVHVTTLGLADVPSQATIPDDGDWHHIAVVHENGVELRFYVDGVLRDTVPYTSGVKFSMTRKFLTIGAEWNGALQYAGLVDRLKVFSGILTPEQLDSRRVPLPGAGELVIGHPSLTPFRLSVGVTEVGESVLDPTTIALTFDGAAVTPSSVTKRGSTTMITYDLPNPPLASGSTYTASLNVKDRKGVSYTRSSSLTVPSYATLPANAALPSSAIDLAHRGFKIRTYQIGGGTQRGTIAYNEALLAGEYGPNLANLDDAGGWMPLGISPGLT